MKHPVLILLTALVCATSLVSLDVGIALAGHCVGGPSVCGQNSGLVPFHKDAIMASLLWSKHKKWNGDKADCPKMIILMRPSEYKPKDYLNPTVGGVFSGFNPKYLELVQGGFGLGQLDRSGWSRYAPDLDRENAQLVDVCKLQALIDAGMFTKTMIANLLDADVSLTNPSFQDAGYSKGLSYNLFCMGQEMGADGRLYVFGLHDKGGNNGGRKVNIFNPRTERWVWRGKTCVRSGWETDPNGTIPPHCDPLNENNTDPPLPSDMKYQRWYPTTVALPDGRILILSGTDQDSSVGDAAASGTKVRQAVPEVYDPKTDTTVALENARKLLPMYPRSFVVQTGPGKNDWKVAVVAEVDPNRPLPGQPGGPNIGGYDPFFYIGRTHLLDVQAALADPAINVPAANHWTYVTTALNAHDGAAAAIKVKINANGTWSQEVYAFGGTNGSGSGASATVEKINFSDANPAWQPIDNLILPADQNNVVILPDGKFLVVGGRGAGVNTLHYQMYDPATGVRTDLVESPVPRHDHSTALLVPNGGVWVMGGNRVQLIPGGNENQAIPVMEFYRPPYFFKGPRPVIVDAPYKLRYGKTFEVRSKGGEIGSVALLRTGPITHNWTWGNRYVELPFEVDKKGRLQIMAPPLPGLAIAGDYLLFVVNKDGVPSEGKRVRLKLPHHEWEGDHDDEDDD
jgi:Domain of unknown function (DUF1929)